jgi:ketosteroid isomerase-like protein
MFNFIEHGDMPGMLGALAEAKSLKGPGQPGDSAEADAQAEAVKAYVASQIATLGKRFNYCTVTATADCNGQSSTLNVSIVARPAKISGTPMPTKG